MKRAFTEKLHATLGEVSGFITNQVKTLTKDIVKSICAFEYIFSCIYLANFYISLVLKRVDDFLLLCLYN